MNVDMVHDMAVAERVDGYQVELPTLRVISIFPIQAGLFHVSLKYLTDTVSE